MSKWRFKTIYDAVEWRGDNLGEVMDFLGAGIKYFILDGPAYESGETIVFLVLIHFNKAGRYDVPPAIVMLAPGTLISKNGTDGFGILWDGRMTPARAAYEPFAP